MATALIKSSFAAGELSPSLWGRVDVAKWHVGATVLRNMFVNYRGGAASRAGLGFVGQCLQAASAAKPRIIPFRFSVFQNYALEFGDRYMRVIANGAYVTETALAITAITQANPAQLTIPGNTFAPGDWFFTDDIVGMTELNGRTLVVRSVAGSNVTVNDTFGNALNSLDFNAYVSGGTAARIFTLTTPYAAVDLDYLKYTQSADVMSLCCVDPQTNVEYATQDLTRLAANNWTIAPPTIATSIAAPASPSAVASTAGSSAYGYVVTAIDALTGEESVASVIAAVTSAVNISSTFGTITVSWTAVTGASGYNIYRATPDYTNTGNFTGQLFGYVGSTAGAVSWHDTNIIADFTVTPPLHLNPFSGAGNAPAEVAYFQQRRGYFGSLNDPDGYDFSQPGAYTNFDSADPPIDSDAISGNPWAQQVNGIQSVTPMPGGLLVGTGLEAWQLSGTGGAGTPITPSQQSATPQDSYGFSATLPMLRLGDHILYVPQSGTSVQDMAYNFWNNMYAGTDISVLSSHLFVNYQVSSWASCRQPWKIVWVVRNDGRLLSLTYLKEQEVAGFARHDTQGLFQSVCAVTELPVDAPYFVVRRYIAGQMQWAYYTERMDNRQWRTVEGCFCVDAGVALPQPTPNATLTASASAPTLGAVAGPVILGGSNYSAAVSAQIVDPTGEGAVVDSITVLGGAITAYTIDPPGEGYTRPTIVFSDATGTGASAQVYVDQSVQFSADAAVFTSGDVGSVIRMGGGIATVTGIVSPTVVDTTMTSPITATVPNDPNAMPLPAASGQWTMTQPVSTLRGLDHLEGMLVTGLGDGAVIPPTQVVEGAISVANPISSAVVGLGYVAQLQSMHTDLGSGGSTMQGKPVKITGVTARIESSRDFSIGQDRPIASAEPNQAEYPWTAMEQVKSRVPPPPSQGPVPLFTGDRYIPIRGDWNLDNGTPNGSVPMPGEAPRAPGMVACQQDNPLPMTILALIPNVLVGDTNDQRDLMG